MEENGRYIAIIAGALVLMALALGGAYYAEQHGRITRRSATLELQQQLRPASTSSEMTSAEADTATASKQPGDTIREEQLSGDALRKQLRREAEQTAYRWQQKIDALRFREQAAQQLGLMSEHGIRMHDSLMNAYSSREDVEQVVGAFDEQWRNWYERLDTQVGLLPTAAEALAAEQISEDEYRRIQKESTP